MAESFDDFKDRMLQLKSLLTYRRCKKCKEVHPTTWECQVEVVSELNFVDWDEELKELIEDE